MSVKVLRHPAHLNMGGLSWDNWTCSCDPEKSHRKNKVQLSQLNPPTFRAWILRIFRRPGQGNKEEWERPGTEERGEDEKFVIHFLKKADFKYYNNRHESSPLLSSFSLLSPSSFFKLKIHPSVFNFSSSSFPLSPPRNSCVVGLRSFHLLCFLPHPPNRSSSERHLCDWGASKWAPLGLISIYIFRVPVESHLGDSIAEYQCR